MTKKLHPKITTTVKTVTLVVLIFLLTSGCASLPVGNQPVNVSVSINNSDSNKNSNDNANRAVAESDSSALQKTHQETNAVAVDKDVKRNVEKSSGEKRQKPVAKITASVDSSSVSKIDSGNLVEKNSTGGNASFGTPSGSGNAPVIIINNYNNDSVENKNTAESTAEADAEVSQEEDSTIVEYTEESTGDMNANKTPEK